MYSTFFIILTAILQVSTSQLCDDHSGCVCLYDNKNIQEFTGEDVDCSYTDGAILKINRTQTTIIRSLDLSANNLTSVHSSDVLRSATMTELYLKNNLITQITSDAFQLPELRKLDLSDNRLESLHGDIFKSIRKLQYLNLANNRFTTFSKLTFHPLGNLEEIVLDNNNLGPSLEDSNLFDRSGFGLTNKIKNLSISDINLNNVPDNFFVDAYDIRKLVISNNNITEVFELPFTLEYLDLSDNPIKFISAEDFSDLLALKHLILNHLSIKEVSEYTFSSLRGLLSLQLERNLNLTVFSRLAFGQEVLDDPEEFVLESLSLRDSRLSQLNKDLLVPFGHLSNLDLQGNPWKCDCNIVWIKELQITPDKYQNLRCFTPTPLYNAVIFELDSDYLTCPASRHYVGLALAFICFCIILSSMAVWMFVYLPRCQSRGTLFQEMYAPSVTYTILPVLTSHSDID